MLHVAVLLLIANSIVLTVVYIKIRRNFSQNVYRENMQKEVHKLIVDIRMQTEQSVSLLENKIEELQDAIARADKYMNVAKKELTLKKTEYAMLSQLAKPAKSAEKAEVYTQERITRTEKQVRSQLRPEEEVLELFAQGFSPDMIEQRVDLPIGEIELIITLNGYTDV